MGDEGVGIERGPPVEQQSMLRGLLILMDVGIFSVVRRGDQPTIEAWLQSATDFNRRSFNCLALFGGTPKLVNAAQHPQATQLLYAILMRARMTGEFTMMRTER